MPKHNYSNWLPKQEAAAVIGCSTKHIERLAQEKLIQAAKYKRPKGGPAIAVYHPGDVERQARERNPDAEPFVMPAAAPPAVNGSKAIAVRQSSPEEFMEALAKAIAGASQTSQTGVRLAERLYLTMGEAAEYTGLGLRYLRRQIAVGNLELVKGAGHHGANVLRRADLEKL
jgi:excisionase family DNA binding protein